MAKLHPFLLSLSVLCVAASFTTPVSAQKPRITKVSVDPDARDTIYVTFDLPRPAASVVIDPNHWLVYEKVAGNVQRIETDTVDPTNLASTGEVVLHLKERLPSDATLKEVDIVFAGSQDFIAVPALTSKASLGLDTTTDAGGVVAAKGKSDSDIYFNGSYTGVVAGDAVYDIDAFAGYMKALQSGHFSLGSIGMYGQIRTKTSAVVDPNSYLTYLVYQKVVGHNWYPRSAGRGAPFQAPIFSYRALGAEFDRSATQLNLITSPVVTFPFRPVPPPDNASGKVIPWPQLNISLGSEFVYVNKSVLAPTGKSHTRGLASATFVSGYAPKTTYIDSFTLTSSYQLRLPSSPEIFYDSKFAPLDPSTGKPNPKKTPPMLGTQPRHYIDTKFTYNYSKWGGLTFEHTYGSLPPAFNKTKHSFAVGLTLNLQFSEFGRYSILKP